MTAQNWADWNGPDWGDVRFKSEEVLRFIDNMQRQRMAEVKTDHVTQEETERLDKRRQRNQ